MSRKLILSLAAAATIAASLGSNPADAMGFGRGGFGGGHFAGRGGRTLTSVLNPVGPGRPGRPGHPGYPGHPGHPGRPGHWVHLPHHGHLVFRGGRWIVIDEAVGEAPAAVATEPGPCTCLTKTYTPDGLVVFADICTKESASAPVDGKSADATPTPKADDKSGEATPAPGPSDYAGRTYRDYLAANPQAAPSAAQKN